MAGPLGDPMMKMHAWMAACAVALLPLSAAGQDAKKWKPYQFAGNERYEFKIVSRDGDEKKETGYILDIRKKGAEEWDVTWSIKSTMKKSQGAELLMGGLGMGLSPALLLMNPLFGAFLEQVELKEGEKMSLFGAGMIKVTKKEEVGGRSGLICEL